MMACAAGWIPMRPRGVSCWGSGMSSGSRCRRKERRRHTTCCAAILLSRTRTSTIYVLLKSDGLPTYHLAAMVDDHLMQITHVMRGAEWLSTFPLHVNVVRAFGWEEPEWLHLSLFLKPSGKGKLSKRDAAEAIKDGYSVFVKDMQDLGFIPEGILNWIVLMGWGVPEDDVLTIRDMVDRFDLAHLTVSPAAINFAKLDHFNGTHIRMLTDVTWRHGSSLSS